MLDLSIAALALFVTLLIVPAFVLASAFAISIPFFTAAFLIRAWKQRNGERLTEGLKPSHRTRRHATHEHVWRRTG